METDISEEDFYNFRPETLFASDSRRQIKLIGIWVSELGMRSYQYKVISNHVETLEPVLYEGGNFAKAIRVFNTSHDIDK